jgi:hypothetical protein
MTGCNHISDSRCFNQNAIDAYGTIPSSGVCRICEHYEGSPRGAGDIVHSVASALRIDSAVEFVAHSLGVSDCGCEQRRAALNAAVPFTDKPKEG